MITIRKEMKKTNEEETSNYISRSVKIRPEKRRYIIAKTNDIDSGENITNIVWKKE